MIKYKSKEFFNDYFSNLQEFVLKTPFKDIEDEFIGIIEAKEAIHPLSIEVVVPKMFPYQKVMFWTDSLLGYPHLIYNSDKAKSWFCLNTPFAETPENQLDLEIDRLKGWIKRMMHSELPSHIENPIIANSLRFANVYSWEIFGNDAYSSKARLIFVGDFAITPNNIAKEGVLHCRKISISDIEARFYAYENDEEGLTDIPYVLVEGLCENPMSLQSLNSFYGFDEDVWNRLLPYMHLDFPTYTDDIMFVGDAWGNMKDIDNELKETTISPEHREYVEYEIGFLKHYNDETSPSFPFLTRFDDDFVPFNVGETIMGEYFAERIKCYLNKEFYFALGNRIGSEIEWYLFSTSRSRKISKNTTYKIGKIDIHVHDLIDVQLDYYKASVTDYQHFFGRGCLDSRITNKKIALIGVGAIGSCLLESLVDNVGQMIPMFTLK